MMRAAGKRALLLILALVTMGLPVGGLLHPGFADAQPVSPPAEETRVRADALFRAGSTDRDPATGVDLLTLSLGLYRQIEDRRGEAFSLDLIGSWRVDLSQPALAADSFEAALAVQRSQADWLGEILTLALVGVAIDDLGNDPRLASYRGQGRAALDRLDERRQEGASLFIRGVVNKNLESLDRAAAIFRDVGDRSAEGTVVVWTRILWGDAAPATPVNSQARADAVLVRALKARDASVALEAAQQALALYQQAGDRRGEAYALVMIGGAHSQSAQPEQARVSFVAALAIQREVGDWLSEGVTLAAVAITYEQQGDEQWFQYLGQVLAVVGSVGPKRAEGFRLVGDTAGSDGQAVEGLERALAIFREVGDAAAEEAVLFRLRLVRAALAEDDRSLEPLDWAFSAYREAGNLPAQARLGYRLANGYERLRYYRRAIDLYEQAAALFEDLGDRFRQRGALKGIAGSYTNLSNVRGLQDTANRARVTALTRALEIDRELGDRRGEAFTLMDLASAHRSLEERAAEVARSLEAVSILEELGDRSEAERQFLGIARAYLALDEHRQALQYYDQILARNRETTRRMKRQRPCATSAKRAERWETLEQPWSLWPRPSRSTTSLGGTRLRARP